MIVTEKYLKENVLEDIRKRNFKFFSYFSNILQLTVQHDEIVTAYFSYLFFEVSSIERRTAIKWVITNDCQ